jgi:C4-type Zn-finger protein
MNRFLRWFAHEVCPVCGEKLDEAHVTTTISFLGETVRVHRSCGEPGYRPQYRPVELGTVVRP